MIATTLLHKILVSLASIKNAPDSTLSVQDRGRFGGTMKKNSMFSFAVRILTHRSIKLPTGMENPLTNRCLIWDRRKNPMNSLDSDDWDWDFIGNRTPQALYRRLRKREASKNLAQQMVRAIFRGEEPLWLALEAGWQPTAEELKLIIDRYQSLRHEMSNCQDQHFGESEEGLNPHVTRLYYLGFHLALPPTLVPGYQHLVQVVRTEELQVARTQKEFWRLKGVIESWIQEPDKDPESMCVA